mmetsp:Transcript_17738/g.30323  ORF Transcript_17738/g.30323 Transcript_17738/m.30323 type:complete len:104 (+) Transcript_17738:520-831(+)
MKKELSGAHGETRQRSAANSAEARCECAAKEMSHDKVRLAIGEFGASVSNPSPGFRSSPATAHVIAVGVANASLFTISWKHRWEQGPIEQKRRHCAQQPGFTP